MIEFIVLIIGHIIEDIGFLGYVRFCNIQLCPFAQTKESIQKYC